MTCFRFVFCFFLIREMKCITIIHISADQQCVVWRLLKSIGVKLKVFVTEDDGIWSGDDDVDGFVQLLRLTPARSVSLAPWSTITMYGLRSSRRTRSVDFSFLSYVMICVRTPVIPSLNETTNLAVTVSNTSAFATFKTRNINVKYLHLITFIWAWHTV